MSGGGDLQANITGRDNGASAAIDQSTKAMERLENQTRKTTKQAKDLQREIKDGFKQSGAAVAKAGGPIGSIGGRVLGGAGMDGNIGRAAVGFGLASLAFSALNKVIEVGVSKTRLLIAATQDLTAARDKGEKVKDDQAKAGATQRDDIARLQGLLGTSKGYVKSGDYAKSTSANDLVANLNRQGFSTADASAGLVAAFQGTAHIADYDQRQAARANVVNEAGNLASLGLGKLPDLIQQLLDGGGTNDAGVVSRRAARMYSEFSGGFANPDKDYAGATRSIGRNPFISAADKMQVFAGKAQINERAQTTERGVSVATADFVAALNPVLDAQRNANRLAQMQIDELQKLGDAQGAFMGLIANLTTGEGSFKTQAIRRGNAQANAVFEQDR